MPDARAPRHRLFPGEKGPQAPRESRKAPPLELEVVEWLESVAPEVVPCDLESANGIWFDHGRRSVALQARALYTRQQET